MQGLWSYISKTGPGKEFQYDIGEVVDIEKKSPWTLHCGKKRVCNFSLFCINIIETFLILQTIQ
jgi:hypothetical protein